MILETEVVHLGMPERCALVADDDAIMRDILSSLLAEAGYKVILAASGREALHLATNLNVSISFIDLAMPDGNGLQTCAALRKLPKWSSVPIIVLTDYSISKALNAALSAGASGFLCKPLIHSEFLWCLEIHTGEPAAIQQKSQIIEELQPQLAVDIVSISEEMLAPIRSECIVGYNPDALTDGHREIAGAKLTPTTTEIGCEDKPAVPCNPTHSVDVIHAPDIDLLCRLAKFFAPGVMAKLLSKLAASIEEILPIMADSQSVTDHDEIERRLHNLAGTAGTLGCNTLSAVARKLEFDLLKSYQTQQEFAETAHATLKVIDKYIRTQSSGTLAPLRKLNVLIVDDTAMNREIAGAFLQAAGHNATCVEGGAEAIAAVSSTSFQVVLMDVRMPGMDGLEATRRIRALDGPQGQVPIVALTSPASADRLAELRNAGMDSHLAKPFTPDTLVAAVLRAVMLASAAAPSS